MDRPVLPFDGLVLMTSLMVGGAIYLIIAVIATAVALWRRSDAARAWAVARAAALMGVFTLIGGRLFFSEAVGPAPTEQWVHWSDLMIFPWAVVFIAGCRILTRLR